jgi:hypothetical protein
VPEIILNQFLPVIGFREGCINEPGCLTRRPVTCCARYRKETDRAQSTGDFMFFWNTLIEGSR